MYRIFVLLAVGEASLRPIIQRGATVLRPVGAQELQQIQHAHRLAEHFNKMMLNKPDMAAEFVSQLHPSIRASIAHDLKLEESMLLPALRQQWSLGDLGPLTTQTSATQPQEAEDPESPDGLIRAPEDWQLRNYMWKNGIPFIGFGIADNGIMIIAGDAVESGMRMMMPITTMAAAAVGNTISDLAGLKIGDIVEDFCERHKIGKPHKLTAAQMELPQAQKAKTKGNAMGLTLGCLLGSAPLLLHANEEEKEALVNPKTEEDRQFQDTVRTALVNAFSEAIERTGFLEVLTETLERQLTNSEPNHYL